MRIDYEGATCLLRLMDEAIVRGDRREPIGGLGCWRVEFSTDESIRTIRRAVAYVLTEDVKTLPDVDDLEVALGPIVAVDKVEGSVFGGAALSGILDGCGTFPWSLQTDLPDDFMSEVTGVSVAVSARDDDPGHFRNGL